MTSIEIRQWKALDGGWNSLLLGNGASIALNDRFGYGSLHNWATANQKLSADAQKLFSAYKTVNFEFVLEALEHAENANATLGILAGQPRKVRDEVRTALIETLKATHCDPDDVRKHLSTLVPFLQTFTKIISLNYDLTLYWTILEANKDIIKGQWFKDCFVDDGRTFRTKNWERLATPQAPAAGATLVFWGHGNLVLAKESLSQREVKIAASDAEPGWSTRLLNTITGKWTNGYTPLFVSEGTYEEKLKTIDGSPYLRIVHKDILPGAGPHIVVYGLGFGASDRHILEALGSSKRRLERIAISVFMGQAEQERQAFCHRVAAMISSSVGTDVKVEFFAHDSPGCWINP